MERSENDSRIDLTPSEKTELAMRIEKALEGRQGGNRKSSDQIWSLDQPQNKSVEMTHLQEKDVSNPVTPPVGRSDEIAAAAVGMKRETYRQAKAVVKSGDQAAIQAMDTGEKSNIRRPS